MSETEKDIPVSRLGERKTGPPTSLTSDCERSTERFVTRTRPSEISTVASARSEKVIRRKDGYKICYAGPN